MGERHKEVGGADFAMAPLIFLFSSFIPNRSLTVRIKSGTGKHYIIVKEKHFCCVAFDIRRENSKRGM